VGTDSFAQLTSPPLATSSVVPELKFSGYPVSEPTAPFAGTLGVNLVATLAEYQGVLAPTGVQWDTTQGWVAFVVYDCGVTLAGGVQVTASSLALLKLGGGKQRTTRPLSRRQRTWS
jgi:hypothetical protein